MKPVDILPEDMCMRCKMAISEKRCAAEFIDTDGSAFKFDDLACMAGYIKEKQKKEAITACFVADYEGGGWVKAADAYFVQSSQIKTPMGGGTVAFRDKAKANEAAVRYRGEVRSFAQAMR